MRRCTSPRHAAQALYLSRSRKKLRLGWEALHLHFSTARMAAAGAGVKATLPAASLARLLHVTVGEELPHAREVADSILEQV